MVGVQMIIYHGPSCTFNVRLEKQDKVKSHELSKAQF